MNQRISLGRRVSLFGVVCLAAFVHAESAKEPTTKTITVQVQARTEDSQPLANVPVSILSFPELLTRSESAITGANGNATITITIPIGEQRVALVPVHMKKMIRGVVTQGSPEERAAITAALAGHSFNSYQWVNLVEGTTDYTVVLTGRPASSFQGNLMKADGTADTATWQVRVAGRVNSWINENGVVKVAGLQRGAPNEVLLTRSVDGFVLRVPLTSEQCAAESTVVESIQVPANTTAAEVLLKVTKYSDVAVKEHPCERGGWISVISVDGVSGYEYVVIANSWEDVDGYAKVGPGGIAPNPRVQLPPGNYYVVAGTITDGLGLRLWDVVKSGRPESELIAAGVPKITVVSGQANSVEVDFVAAYNGFVKMCGTD